MCVFYNNIIAYKFFSTIISFICFSSFCPHRDTVALVSIPHMYTSIAAAAHTTRWLLFPHVLYVLRFVIIQWPMRWGLRGTVITTFEMSFGIVYF